MGGILWATITPADVTLWVTAITAVLMAALKSVLVGVRMIQDFRRDNFRLWHELSSQINNGPPPKKRRPRHPQQANGLEDDHDSPD